MNATANQHPGSEVTPARAHELAGSGMVVLLDVREPYEYAAGHAPGTLWFPLSRLTDGDPLPSGASGRRILCVCRSGNRSHRAMELLVSLGEDAHNVTGGMQRWAEAGLPVVDTLGAAGRIA